MFQVLALHQNESLELVVLSTRILFKLCSDILILLTGLLNDRVYIILKHHDGW